MSQAFCCDGLDTPQAYIWNKKNSQKKLGRGNLGIGRLALFGSLEGEPEESREEADVKSDEEEAELVKPDLPASKDLTNEHNKLAEPEAIVVVEDVDDHDSDELEGLQVAAQVEKESKDSLD